jgi:nucleotide-binding universal stress UspA family protein
VQRVVVATDRSETAERAVRWAADLAHSFSGELVLVQVIAESDDQPADAADFGRAAAIELVAVELTRIAEELAGPRGRARVVVDDRAAEAIVAVAHEESADVIVVGNAGMSGNKKFLLSNVPNRITHMARCTVVTVNTTDGLAATHTAGAPRVLRPTQAQRDDDEQLLLSGRAAKIARVAAKHGLEELFSRRGGDSSAASTRESARNFRAALEELGPTFCKLGQVLSTRPDLVPPEFIEELATLRDNVPPLTEAQVVEVMEEELQVPWEDVFDSIEPTPLATGSIAQVHRATLSSGEKVVVKVQRPGARAEITRDLGLLEVFARKSAKRPGL